MCPFANKNKYVVQADGAMYDILKVIRGRLSHIAQKNNDGNHNEKERVRKSHQIQSNPIQSQHRSTIID